MNTRQTRGWQLVVLWALVLVAFGLALRRGTLVPWGSGKGPTSFGAPLWTLLPLGASLLVTVFLTFSSWRSRATSPPVTDVEAGR